MFCQQLYNYSASNKYKYFGDQFFRCFVEIATSSYITTDEYYYTLSGVMDYYSSTIKQSQSTHYPTQTVSETTILPVAMIAGG